MASVRTWITVLTGLCGGLAHAQVPATTSCVSRDAAGVFGDASSGTMSRVYCGTSGCLIVDRVSAAEISADGRYVAFISDATNLVQPPTPLTRSNVYRKDLEGGAVELISVNPAGAPGDDDSGHASILGGEGSGVAISADGRFVAFTSVARDLVPGDALNYSDVFVRDVATATTVRVSESRFGGAASFDSFAPRMTPDARWIAFHSQASDLVVGDTNTFSDVFVYDRVLNTLELVSRTPQGVLGNGESFDPSLSADGRFVAFCSTAQNFDGPAPQGHVNVFVLDRLLGTIRRCSRNQLPVTSNGDSRWPRISADGRVVVFTSTATNLGATSDPTLVQDVFSYTLGATQALRLTFTSFAAAGQRIAWSPSVSSDGRYVAFHSAAVGLVPGDTNGQFDAFLLDRNSSSLLRVSVSNTGGELLAGSFVPVLSPDARRVVFRSNAANVVPLDTNNTFDVFVRDLGSDGSVRPQCLSAPNSLGCPPSLSWSGTPSASAGSGFHVSAIGLLNRRSGLFFYGTSGATLTTWGSSYLCVRAPRRRTALQDTAGHALPANDCTGHLTLDFNAQVALGLDPALVAGREVWMQGWSRDSGLATSTHLTQALYFQLGP